MLSLILVGVVVWMLTGTVKAIDAKVTAHTAESNFYLRAICLNTATTEAQRAACIPVEPRK